MGRVFTLVGLLLLLSVVSCFAAKPEPPARLATIFTEVVEIEDAVSAGEWKLALQKIDEIENLLGKTASSIRSAAGEDNYQFLRGSVAELKEGLQLKNQKDVSTQLLKLQTEVFRTMEFYNYSVHPSFLVIQEYVAEAGEAVENKDFDRVIHEMKEVANVLTTSAAAMERKGVGKGMQRDFRDHLVSVMTAAVAKDQQQAIVALKKMEILSGAFVWMGNRQ